MAKGQMKGNKEAKKPKGDKPKSGGSAYKLSQGAPGARPPTRFPRNSDCSPAQLPASSQSSAFT